MIVDMIEEAIWAIVSCYMFAFLLAFLLCYLVVLKDRYGGKWKYFKPKKKGK